MSILISGVYADPSTALESGKQASTPVPPASATPEDDTVILSEAAEVSQLNLQGATPTQIAEKLGIPMSTVDLDLGIIAASQSVSVAPAQHSAPASSTSTSGTSGSSTATSTHPVTATPAAPAATVTTPAATPGATTAAAAPASPATVAA